MIEPIEVTNLARTGEGNAALPWSRAYEALAKPDPIVSHAIFVNTVSPSGRPHSAGIAAIWHDGGLHFTSSPAARKARNLAADPHATVTARFDGIDLVMFGEALRVTDPGRLAEVAARYHDQGWPVEVDGDAFTAPYAAPSAGPPPYNLYRFEFDSVIGTGLAEPHGATRWRFSRRRPADPR